MSDISRRNFLEATAAAIAAGTVAPGTVGAAGQQTDSTPAAPRTQISVTVNGRRYQEEIEDRWTLADFLRDRLQLTGTKVACDRGECGACTILLDGSAVYACSYLAVWTHGRSVETVEGLASGATLHPLQKAFIEHDAPQCGFCTSGQLMSAKALLAANPHPTADVVRAALTGNICRCANYNHYVDAVVAAGKAGGSRGGAE